LLAGVSVAEAEWQHAAYAREESRGLASPGTIAWHLSHLEQCPRRYVEILRRRPVQSTPHVPALPTYSYPEIILTLQGSRATLRREIASIADAELDTPCRGDMSLRDFVLMITRHEAWHAGQIVVVRRLFRSRA
jgi:hypothetical protein